MSLKAKLEAVIYAAEEPVTLAQLAGLFAEEALELKAEREAATATHVTEGADGGALQLNEAFPHLGLEPVGDGDASASAEPAADGSEESAEPIAGEEADGAAEAKRAAKLRERETRTTIKQVLDELIAEYAADERGIEIREIAGGYRMATKPQCHDAVRLFVKSLKPALKLSLPALETLAVIAYKQPVTAPEVNEIRGVDSSGVFGSLLARKLIVTAGRKQVVGRPILYKTTREFLLRFGLKDVTELPSMEEFEKMAASELDEAADEMAKASDKMAEASPRAGDETAAEAAEFDADMSAERDMSADTDEAASEVAAEVDTTPQAAQE
jgi:segregation and condensation protein B